MADIKEIENAIETIKCFYTENENCQNLACEMQSPNCKHERELAFNLALEALEKQMPKKPIRPYEDIKLYFCPHCEMGVNINFETIDNCYHCGQKLDWTK